MTERCYRFCIWCKKGLGFTRKEYCSGSCKMKAYRTRKRGHKQPRHYRTPSNNGLKKGSA